METPSVPVLRSRMQRARDQIAAAALRTGRDPKSIRLVVVTKSQPLELVRAAIDAGAVLLGENYAEEAVAKISALKEKSEVEWHMIGHVQSRKADLVAGHFNMLHSLDSLKLAGRLDRECGERKRSLPVLLEFNVGGEASKSGFPAWDESRWPELLPVLGQIVQLERLRVQGLMTMPPFYDDPEQSRPYFQRLRRLRDFLSERLPQVGWRDLSMGTSIDFSAAVEEGATYVRIGQAIVGPRPG
jgi:pyridoxal phosphate enzyme (YggS family)